MPLNHELQSVLNQACAEFPVQNLSGIEEKVREAVQNDDAWVLVFLKKMNERAQNLPEGDDIAECLRFFFRVRWAYIKSSSADYFRFSRSPANLRCTLLAEALVKQNEPIALILMPTLLEREYLAGSLMDLTETNDDAGNRHLSVDNTFLLMENNTTLFPLRDWVEYLTNPAEPYYNHLYTVDGKLIPLSQKEIDYIIDVSPAYPLYLIDQIEHYQNLRRSQKTLYGVISTLIEQLRAAGVSQVQGREERAQRDRLAAPGADEAVSDFYEIWDAIPDSEQKTEILHLRKLPFNARMIATYGTHAEYEANHPSFEEYLSVLRHCVGLPCTERQRFLSQAAKFLNCVEVIATGIGEILQANPKSFENMITSQDHEDEDQPDQEMNMSFDEDKAGYIADLLSHKNEIIEPEILIPNNLIKFADSYQKRLLELPLPPQDFALMNLKDILFTLTFSNDAEAATILRLTTVALKNSILRYALDKGIPTFAVLAIQNGADLSTRHNGLDLLSAAIDMECEPLINALLEINLSNLGGAWLDNSSTPLHKVFELGQLGLARKILENLRQSLGSEALMNLFQLSDEEGETVIDIIVHDLGLDALKMAEEILGENVFYNILKEGKSPLAAVVERNDMERLNYILSKTHTDLLHIANEEENMVAHLIAFNGYQESLDCIAEFFGKGKDWDDLMLDKDPLNQTSLHLAASQGHLGIVKTILEMTSPALLQNIITANNLSAQSCVQLALVNGWVDIALLLLKSPVLSPSVSASAYARAFDFAIQQREPAMMLAILQADQTNTLSLEKIDTALRLAMELATPLLATALIKKQASLGVTWHQNTVLHMALRRCWLDVIGALLERPEDLKTIMTLKNEYNRVALDVVHPDVPDELRQELEALVKRPQSSPPPSPNKKKKM